MLVVELFLGLGWARAAGEKIIDVNWWTGDVLHEFLADHVPVTIGWYEPFLVRVVAPHVVLVAVTVVALQLFAGAALLTGRNRTAGLIIGMFLNLHVLAAGAVNPSAFYLLAQGAVLLAIAEARSIRAGLGARGEPGTARLNQHHRSDRSFTRSTLREPVLWRA